MSLPLSDGKSRVVGIILVVASMIYHIFLLGAAWDVPRLSSRFFMLPLAPDYANYWCAARLALEGKAKEAYDINELHEFQKNIFGSHHYYGCGWYYPPSFLLFILPLGFLPYFPSLIIWLGVTILGYFIILGCLSYPSFLLFFLGFAFPGAWENIIFGQNGFLSATFLGGGLLLLQSFPFWGGSLLGLLSYKPNLFFLPCLALLCGRHWRALAGAITSAVAVTFLSVVVFGMETWRAYFHIMAKPQQLLEEGMAMWDIMPTPFSAILSLGLSPSLAYVCQAGLSLMAAAGVAWVWRRPGPFSLRAAVLILGVLLFTPYLFVYDLAVLYFALVWLGRSSPPSIRPPLENLLLMCGWLCPAFIPLIWHAHIFPEIKLQIGPLVISGLFLMALAKERRR